jgi:hypothetical protein
MPGMASKTKQRDKAERRDRREAKARRKQGRGVHLRVLGGWMEPELQDRIRAAAAGLDPTAPWAEISPKVLPVIRRVHHPYPPSMDPLRLMVPPGIPTGFGIDFGPAFSHVTPDLVERWGVDHATLLATALDNLQRLTVDEPPKVDRFSAVGMDLVSVQGQGWGSALLLLPEVLGPILGTEPRVLLAPVRNTIVALPDDATLEQAMDIWEAVTDGAPDELDVEPLRWTGVTVAALGDRATRGLVN